MAGPVQPDWMEHADTLVTLAGVALVASVGSLIGVVVWALKKREESLGQRITDGFNALGDKIALVVSRLDQRLDSTWVTLEDHGQEIKAHRERLENIEVICAGQHGHKRRDD